MGGRIETVAPSPELTLVRRSLLIAPPALLLALVLGVLFGNAGAAASAVLGVVVVFTNLCIRGVAAARAARISPIALAATDMIGFVVRLGVIFLVLVALDRVDWFSPVAFAASVIPCTIVVLATEMKQLRGRLQVDLWNFGDSPA